MDYEARLYPVVTNCDRFVWSQRSGEVTHWPLLTHDARGEARRVSIVGPASNSGPGGLRGSCSPLAPRGGEGGILCADHLYGACLVRSGLVAQAAQRQCFAAYTRWRGGALFVIFATCEG